MHIRNKVRQIGGLSKLRFQLHLKFLVMMYFAINTLVKLSGCGVVLHAIKDRKAHTLSQGGRSEASCIVFESAKLVACDGA